MGRTIPRKLHRTSPSIEAAFCVSGGETVVDETSRATRHLLCLAPGPSAVPMFASASCLRSRRMCLEQFRTAAGWPWSAQRGRVRPGTGGTIPRKLHRISPPIEAALYTYLDVRGMGGSCPAQRSGSTADVICLPHLTGNPCNPCPSAVTRSTDPCAYQSPSTMRSAACPSRSSACMAGRCVWP